MHRHPSAASSSYRVVRTDVGSTLRVSVTATNGAGSLTAETDATEAVPNPGAVSNVFPPSLSEWSSPAFGGLYAAYEVGWWTGAPTVTDQWQRCDPLTYEPETGSMTCVAIPGATDPFDYLPQAADVGFKLRLKETATAAEESQVAYSEPSPEVQQFTYDEEGSYTGLAVVGETITADSTATSNAGLPVTTHYTFLREDEGEETTVLQEGEEASYRLTEAELGHHVLVQMTSTIWRADRAAVITTREVELTLRTIEAPPTNEALPAIEGTTTAGATLTASHGEWSGGGGPLTYAYQWQRCDAEGAECTDIRDATDPTYTSSLDDVGHTLRITVTASNSDVRGTATSNPTEAIAAATAASNTEPPTISGEAAELQTLTAEHGRWTGDTPITYAYQWERCKPDGSECQDVEGATQQTYRVASASAGFTLRVRVVATNPAGPVPATSSATSGVTAAPAPQNTTLPRLTLLGAAEAGSTLMTDGGAWQSIDHSELGYVWQRCDRSGTRCADIPGAQANAYDLTSDDVGSRIQAEVLAQNESGEAVAVSELSPPIVASTGSAAGKLVYATGESLGTAQPDGSSAEVVSYCPDTGPVGGCDFQHPRISPNGKMILASRQATLEAGPAQIVLMNRDGTDVRTIATATAAYEPSWTPDGTAIAYTTEDSEGHTSLARISADGFNAAEPETIPTAGTTPESASYSTDGERLIYTATDPEGHRALYTANANGERAHEVIFDGTVAGAENPALSFDGTHVTFAAHTTTPDMPEEVRDLYTANIDGSDLHKLTRDGNSYDSAAPLGNDTLLAIHRNVIITEFGFGDSIEVREPTVWQMDANGANGHPLPVGGAKEISVGPHGGPVAHTSVLGGSHNPESGLKPDERAFCRAHLYFCYVTRGDERKAIRLQELLFTSSADPHISDNTQSNAFRHALWVALMTHTAYHIDYSPLLAYRLAELHEHEQHGKPEWESHDRRVRRPSLMDLHNDLAGYLYVLQRLGSSHNEHYICTHVLNIVRHGKLLTAAQVDHEPRYVTQEEAYWFRHLDTFNHPVQILESILPIRECG